MPDLEISGLDDRIRDLVARAVADAPPAPMIDEHTLEESAMLRPNTQSPSDRNRWIVGGIAGLSVAAAVIALIFVTRPDDPTTTVPVTQPTTFVPETAPATEPATPVSTVYTTVPPVITAPAAVTTPATVPATAPPTTAPAPASVDQSITIATFDGIQLDTGDAVSNALVGYPAQTAHRVPDGRIFFQRRSLDPPGIFEFAGSDTDVPQVQLPVDFAGQPVLHDAAVVNGEVVLLVESSPGQCTDPNTCFGSVWAIRPDLGTGTKLDEQIVWEAGYSQLSLSATGVVVGMKSAEVSSSPWSVAIPGATAAPIDPVAIGLEVDYIDCSTCPTALTIDSTGRFVGWMQRHVDGTATIVVKRVVDGVTLAYGIADPSKLPAFGSLDIGRLADDGSGVTSGAAIVNAGDPAGEQGALVFDLGDPSNEPIVIGPVGTRMAFGA